MSCSSKTRIVIIGPTPPPYNGMSVVIGNLLRSDLRNHFDIISLDTADRRGLANVGRLDLFNVVLALKHGLQFLWILVARRPEIIYVCIAQNTLGYLRDCVFMVPALLAGRKVVAHLHGSDFRRFYEQTSFTMKWLIRWTLSRVNKMIVLGSGLTGLFKGIVPDDRMAVIPNGIKPFAYENTNSQKQSDHKHFRILYLGTLMKTKGFMEFLRSIPMILKEVPSSQFMLVGEHCYPGEMQEAYEFIKTNHLSDVIELPAVLVGNNKEAMLLKSDVFVFPPIAAEGQPLVILEAMAAGLPVISTPQGAIPDMVIDGVNGFLVPPGDPAAIAEKVVLLLKDEPLRLRMGEYSHGIFLKRFTLDRWRNDMKNMFLQVSRAL
jgi:glycosyltransferase involved in cell wall biosynthesis